jgi:hypothetical protein
MLSHTAPAVRKMLAKLIKVFHSLSSYSYEIVCSIVHFGCGWLGEV